MKKDKLPNIVAVSILTLITAIMWVGFNVYRALSLKPSPAVPSEISNPITPSLDKETLSKIGSKIFLDESQIPEFKLNQTPAPNITPAPSAIASPSAIPSASPASQSGNQSL